MEKGNGTHEEASSPGWGASFLVQTAEDASGITVTPPSPSPRSSVVFSSKGDTSPLQKLQNQVFRALKGLSPPSEDKSRTYNPEVLTSQKRQWASFQLDALVCKYAISFFFLFHFLYSYLSFLNLEFLMIVYHFQIF